MSAHALTNPGKAWSKGSILRPDAARIREADRLGVGYEQAAQFHAGGAEVHDPLLQTRLFLPGRVGLVLDPLNEDLAEGVVAFGLRHSGPQHHDGGSAHEYSSPIAAILTAATGAVARRADFELGSMNSELFTEVASASR